MTNDPNEASEPSVAKPLKAAIDAATKANHEVGFRNPPKANQFKKGQSGNPKGRPKTKVISDVAPLIEGILAEPTKIREGERVRTVSNLEATLHAQFVRALNGNPKAIRTIFTRSEKTGLLSKTQMKGFIEFIEPQGEDGEIIRLYRTEMAGQAAPTGSAEKDPGGTGSELDR